MTSQVSFCSWGNEDMDHKIRVMLVDDEYLAIEDLKTLIDWESAGFEICSSASSGRQALRIFREKPVDLVITDISMPGMDGISLIEQLKSLKSDLLFLLLTAYAEVDYMKKAFRLGVQDYLIKDEITPHLLREKLAGIRDSFLTAERQRYSLVQKTMRRYFSSADAPFPEERDLDFDERLLYCILAPDIFVLPWFREAATATLSISQILDHTLPAAEAFETESLQNLCAVSSYNNKLLLLLKAQDVSSTTRVTESLKQFCSGLTARLREQTKISFSCFYSYIPMSLKDIHADYFSRQKAVRARYFLGQNTIEALNSKRLYITNKKMELTENTLTEIYEKPDGNLISFLNAQFEAVIKTHNYLGLTHLLHLSFWFLSRYVPDFESDCLKEDLTDLNAVRNFIRQSLELLYIRKDSGLSWETRKALAYIDTHYSEESLSIQEIADEVCLSATHFSRIFKENTGETVWDYLTALRIKKACQLLASTDKKIYEIAEQTGYSSPQYFSQVFFKQLGMKPLDYRRKSRQ